jgi:hypothetical protein
MNNAAKTVRIETCNVGQNFGTVGVVRDARTGRKLAVTDDTYPLGFTAAACAAAEALAERKGWTVLASDEE